jgi:hypothetical protein
MGLKFKLKGLAETFIDRLKCPSCGSIGSDESLFGTELTRVTFEGIIVVVECKLCGELFVPSSQRLGIVDICSLREAVEKDSKSNGEAFFRGFKEVALDTERLNAEKKGEIQ